MEFSLPSHRLDFGRNPHFLSGISNFASFPLQTTHIDCQPWYSPKQNTTTTTHGDKNEKRSSRSLLCAKNLLCKVLAGRQGRALVVIINSTTLTYQTCSKHAAEERKSLFLHEGRNNEHHLWSFFLQFCWHLHFLLSRPGRLRPQWCPLGRCLEFCIFLLCGSTFYPLMISNDEVIYVFCNIRYLLKSWT